MVEACQQSPALSLSNQGKRVLLEIIFCFCTDAILAISTSNW